MQCRYFLIFCFLVLASHGAGAMQRAQNQEDADPEPKVRISAILRQGEPNDLKLAFEVEMLDLVKQTFALLPRVAEDLNVQRDTCRCIDIAFEEVLNVGTLDTLCSHLWQFQAVQKLVITIRRASADVVRDLIAHASVLAYNAGLTREEMQHSMSLGLTQEDFQALGVRGHADAEEQVFAPTLVMDIGRPLNWMPAADGLFAGVHLEILRRLGLWV